MVFHFLWTFLVFGGAFYMLFVPSYSLIQIVVLSITLLVALPFKGLCPVTGLENHLRKKIDPAYDNHGSFMTTYINKIFGTNVRRREVDIAIAAMYVLCYSYAILALVRGA